MSDQFSGFVFMQSWSGQTADALYLLVGRLVATGGRSSRGTPSER